MNIVSRLMSLSAVVILAGGCSAYSADDYSDPNVKMVSKCVNMEPAQKMKCEEQERSLQLGLGADENCNHPYEYERNRCKSAQAKQEKALAESLKKHSDK